MDERLRPPRVFTVDTYSSRPPPVPPRPLKPGRRGPRRGGGAGQKLLLLLVAAVLCGLLIEGYYILQLYQKTAVSENSGSFVLQTLFTFFCFLLAKSSLLVCESRVTISSLIDFLLTLNECLNQNLVNI